MAGVRMTGLVSGMDTESLIQQLSQAYQKKVDNVKKQQTKAEWKKDAWSSLNTKLMNFYKGALSTFKSAGTYNSKKAIGDLKGVKITAGSNAVSGSHKVQVTSTASAKMWTGNKISGRTYSATSYTGATDGDAKISDLYDKNGYSVMNSLNGSSFKVSKNGEENATEVTINIDENTTVNQMVEDINNQLTGTGLTASFEKGALKFTNTTGQEIENDATGEKIYTGDTLIVTADSKASAAALGLAYDEKTGKGMAVDYQTSADATNNSVSGGAFVHEKQVADDAKITGASKLTDLGISDGAVIKVNGKDIVVDRTTTLSGLAAAIEKEGINASFDANQGRFYISSKNTGLDNAFDIQADEATMRVLGLDFNDPNVDAADKGKAIEATDAAIVYNGVTYTQSTNAFSINGLTIEASTAGEEQEFSVDMDVDGIYDKVKNFVKEYNALIKEMNDLYNAESSRGYEPLTSEEKDAMTEDEVKNWEDKIKGSLLRRDSTISSLLTSMRTILNKSVEVTNADGTTSRFSLASFGIVTGQWSERGQLHIEGDSEDADYADLADKLKAALMKNPDALEKTFSSIGNEVYSSLMKAMKRTDLSSALTFYNDVQMDNDIRDYKDKVKKEQEKMNAEEDKYYKQFSAMETAMAKLQSQQTYISQLFGS